jgi:nitrate/TMAO reductase-like tetraheme cytochrome c subunit
VDKVLKETKAILEKLVLLDHEAIPDYKVLQVKTARLVLAVIRATKAIRVIAEKREIKVNEENKVYKEFLVNEGSVENAASKDRQVLTEPLDEMEKKARQEREVLKAFLAEMERMEKTEQTDRKD